MCFYNDEIDSKYPHVPNLWTAVDGLKMILQEPGEDGKQNKYFNSWTHGYYINSVFVFSPDGKICMKLLNASRTFHDSKMIDYGIYKGIQMVYDNTGGKLVVDSAFNIGSRYFLIKLSQ